MALAPVACVQSFVAALFVAAAVVSTGNSHAQQSQSAFAGTWIRDATTSPAGRSLPMVTWRVAIDNGTLVLTEVSEAGQVTRSASYSEAKATSETAAVESAERTFSRNEPDGRITLRDFVAAPESRGMAITEFWELTKDRAGLHVRRTFRPLDDMPIKLADVVYTFRRAKQ